MSVSCIFCTTNHFHYKPDPALCGFPLPFLASRQSFVPGPFPSSCVILACSTRRWAEAREPKTKEGRKGTNQQATAPEGKDSHLPLPHPNNEKETTTTRTTRPSDHECPFAKPFVFCFFCVVVTLFCDSDSASWLFYRLRARGEQSAVLFFVFFTRTTINSTSRGRRVATCPRAPCAQSMALEDANLSRVVGRHNHFV